MGINAAIFTSGLSMTISPGKLGEVLKSVFVRRVSGAPIARTAPAVIAERATDGTGMVLWGFLGAFALNLPPWTMLMFLAVAIFGIAVLRSKRLSLAAERILAKLPLVNRFAPHLRDFHGASNELLGDGHRSWWGQRSPLFPGASSAPASTSAPSDSAWTSPSCS